MPKALSSASFWHYASLCAGLVALLVLQSGQWFYFDDWAFIEIDGAGPMTPHVGHWSLSPTLVYDMFRELFGLGSYVPYALSITLVHLAAAHIIWRIMMRTNVHPWIATLGALIFTFLGTGSENILWAFQIGYVGALVLGLTAFYLAMAEAMSRRRFVAVLLISVFSLTWSGTAIPLVVATALLLLWRAGWRTAVLFSALAAAVYLSWYVLFQGYAGPDTGGFGLHKLFVDMPQFIGVMLILGFGDLFPVPGLGFALLLALAAWLVVVVVRKQKIAFFIPPLALAAAAALFAFMSAYSRAELSVGSGRASRYVYLLVLLLLPLFAIALSRLVRDRPRILIAVCSGMLLLAAYQSFVLTQAAITQSATEQGSNRLLSASLQLYVDDTAHLNLEAVPDPSSAPDITMRDLIALYEGGYLPIDEFNDADLKQAQRNVLTEP